MTSFAGHPQAMLTEIYIEALLVDEETADQVWEAWLKYEVNDINAYFAWRFIGRPFGLRVAISTILGA